VTLKHKQNNTPLYVRKRLPQQYYTILNRFQLVKVNRWQAVMESLSPLRHRLPQTIMQPRETSQCTDVVISSTTNSSKTRHKHTCHRVHKQPVIFIDR